MNAGALTAETDVVIIGAGLSGLTAARRLVGLGVKRITIVEARDRLGGRIKRAARADGRVLDAGAELVTSTMPTVNRLIDEFGLERVESRFDGKLVRFAGERRFVEAQPFELDPDGAAARAVAFGMVDDLALQVPVEAPWNAPHAAELDSRTLQTWIDENVDDPTIAASLGSAYTFCGTTPSELSLLYALWYTHASGGFEAMSGAPAHGLKDGFYELINRLAVGLEIVLEAPVRAVHHRDDAVTVVTDRGNVTGRVLIAAISPQLCARIQWEPALPPIRDRLQDRYLQGHGLKMVARYDEPWWRREGYAGLGLGLVPIGLMVDSTRPDDVDGTLTGHLAVTAEIAARFSDDLADEQAAERLFRRTVDEYFATRAPAPAEFHYFNWLGDPWSSGCAVGLPPGVLSTVGPALRSSVGTIVWAGAETGTSHIDQMEGAASAGERAADEARSLLDRLK
ncbi:MAG TPA: FAD-dependent oxidoreductase [Baekduia sp.]|nr:FAD-dependent oxidoreductase [Baekduia sp.]